ncbi:hypothetical protein [Rhizobium sp. BG4]|uniref:hypothetical protein n=1 Tax=Rhizobium sp. BG4 TaxID=2613770 RepID=UPI00193D1C37|nr:hypothetical protein [Rhizobium sp. BG4]QRM43148.1 hypothetical protein F2982_06660 [Rhizobium sp. BG4]
MDSAEEVDLLVDLIKNEKRWRNVIVLASDDNFDCSIDQNRLAHKLGGIAHVYFVTPKASFALSNKLGNVLSVFDKGVRMYRPKFGDDDDKTSHPLMIRRRLDNISIEDRLRYEEYLISECFRASIERENLPKIVPSFVDVKFAASKANLTQLGESDAPSAGQKIEAEVAARIAAESQVGEALAMALQEEDMRKTAEQERDTYRSQLFAIKDRISTLEARLAQAGESIEIGDRPTTYDAIANWVVTNFSGKLVLHPRAQKALKSATYQNAEEVAAILSILANEYRNVLLGELRREDFEQILNEKHIEISGSISEEKAKNFGDEYYVVWAGKKNFLHGHVQKGNSRDDRFCLRIYFFWDAIDSIIVVGWLPSHLKNRLS